MNRVFVIADTHFHHSKILEFEKESRPFNTIEEHDAELIYRWNSVVKKKRYRLASWRCSVWF